MTTNINFSFARLMAVMKRDLVENWKTNLYRILGCYSALAFAFLLFMMNRSGHYGPADVSAYDNLCNSISSFLAIFITWYMHIGASSILEITNTKEKRISYLMLPASTSEKFISRAIYVTIGCIVIFLVSLLLAELTRLALLPLFDVPDNFGQFCLGDLFVFDKFELRDDMFFIPLLFIGLSIFLWSHSIFILGGSYFKKHPLLKTLGICIGVLLFFGFTASSIVIEGWLRGLRLDIVSTKEGTVMFMNIASVIFLAFTVLNWSISYRLFKKMQITERKLLKL